MAFKNLKSPFNGHIVKCIFFKGIKILAVRYRATHTIICELQEHLQWCFLNKLKKSTNYTQPQCTWCYLWLPWQWRAQWWGDNGTINEGEMFYLLESSGASIFTKSHTRISSLAKNLMDRSFHINSCEGNWIANLQMFQQYWRVWFCWNCIAMRLEASWYILPSNIFPLWEVDEIIW